MIPLGQGRESSIADLEKVLYPAKPRTIGGRDGSASRTGDGRRPLRFLLLAPQAAPIRSSYSPRVGRPISSATSSDYQGLVFPRFQIRSGVFENIPVKETSILRGDLSRRNT